MNKQDFEELYNEIDILPSCKKFSFDGVKFICFQKSFGLFKIALFKDEVYLTTRINKTEKIESDNSDDKWQPEYPEEIFYGYFAKCVSSKEEIINWIKNTTKIYDKAEKILGIDMSILDSIIESEKFNKPIETSFIEYKNNLNNLLNTINFESKSLNGDLIYFSEKFIEMIKTSIDNIKIYKLKKKNFDVYIKVFENDLMNYLN